MLPPQSHPSLRRALMPRLLRLSADTKSFRLTLLRSTLSGTGMPCSLPTILIHMHRALWICPAIMRTVRRGAPGTLAPQIGEGRCSTRKTVTWLLVSHAARIVSRRLGAASTTSLSMNIRMTANVEAEPRPDADRRRLERLVRRHRNSFATFESAGLKFRLERLAQSTTDSRPGRRSGIRSCHRR